MMPELQSISPWQAVGNRRRQDESRAAAQRSLSDNVFVNRKLLMRTPIAPLGEREMAPAKVARRGPKSATVALSANNNQ